MHEVSIRSDENGRTKVLVDGVDVSSTCLGFNVNQVGGDFPQITLTFECSNLCMEAEQANLKIRSPSSSRIQHRQSKNTDCEG